MHFATLLIYLQIHLYDCYFIFMMTEAIEKMMQRLDEKLDEFRKELKEGQDKVAATAARRARQEPRYVFKKKSHEEQSKVNENVDDAMREAEVELQSEGSSATIPSASNIKSALESLKKGRAVIAERQKLIKIADRSELGWAVVNEYTADELAENSDDEKRMEKAAERKAARKRKAPAEKSKASKCSASAMVPVQTFQPHPSAQFQLPFVRRAPAQQSTPKMPGPCFTCGQMTASSIKYLDDVANFIQHVQNKDWQNSVMQSLKQSTRKFGSLSDYTSRLKTNLDRAADSHRRFFQTLVTVMESLQKVLNGCSINLSETEIEKARAQARKVLFIGGTLSWGVATGVGIALTDRDHELFPVFVLVAVAGNWPRTYCFWICPSCSKEVRYFVS